MEAPLKRTSVHSWLVSTILIIGDVSGILISFYAASQVRRLLIPVLGGVVYWPVYVPVVFFGILFTVFVFLINNQYPGYGLTAVKELERIAKLLTLVFISLSITVYFFRVDVLFPRSIFLTAWFISLLVIPMIRFLIRNRLSLYPWYGIPVLLIADDPQIQPILEAIRNCRRMGWRIRGIYLMKLPDRDFPFVPTPRRYSWERVRSDQQNNHISTAIISGETINNPAKTEFSWRLLNTLFKNIVIVMPGVNFGSVWVEPRDLEGQLGLELTYHLLDPISLFIKDFIDLLGSVLFLLLLSPLLLLVSLLIKIDSNGPVFFLQERLGKEKKRFTAIKFRTMVVNAEHELASLLDNNLAAREEYNRHHKLENDPRITRIGKWLRKYSLDELPQLFNVIRGEMSLIGPRAYLPEELDEIGDYSELIHRVKPGMTGWWQIMGRHQTTFKKRLQMDEYYISNWSLWLDAYILMKTFWVVISGTGE